MIESETFLKKKSKRSEKKEMIADENRCEKEANRRNKSSKKFEIGSKSIFLTYPKCDCDPDFAIDFFNKKYGSQITYMCFSRENHEDGSLHMHGLVQGEPKFHIYSPFTLDIVRPPFELEVGSNWHGHYEGSKDAVKTLAYVKKHGNFKEFGRFISNSRRDVAIEACRKKNEKILSQSLFQSVDEGVFSIAKYCEVKKSVNSYRNDRTILPIYELKECLWICGLPGIGKSRWARDNLPNPYFKSMNKWWDGYQAGQSNVIIDDFDRNGVCLSHYLKIWADSYHGWLGEVKNDSVYPYIKRLVVTSNYRIRELFGPGLGNPSGDEQTCLAILRRFRECTVEPDPLTGLLILVDLPPLV